MQVAARCRSFAASPRFLYATTTPTMVSSTPVSASSLVLSRVGHHCAFATTTANDLAFQVNGKEHVVPRSTFEPDVTLCDYLRHEMHLTGTKLVCGEGGCGACSVAVSSHGDKKWSTVNSCLYPLAAAHGKNISTVEDFENGDNSLHIVQRKMSELFGSQCGFCTPGFVVSLATQLRNKPNSSTHELMHAIEANLCRCTGYRPIASAVQQIVDEMKTHQAPTVTSPALPAPKSVVFSGRRGQWYNCTSLDEVLKLRAQHPEARVVRGNTEIGIDQWFVHKKYPVLLSVEHVPELHNLDLQPHGTSMLGAGVPLTTLLDAIEALPNAPPAAYTDISQLPTWGQEANIPLQWHSFARQLRLFAGRGIRNSACVGGNIMWASPISDLNPLFVAFDAKFHLQSHANGSRVVPAREFFVGYRKVAAQPDEVLTHVELPPAEPHTYCNAYKQSRRREDDIAIANGGLSVSVDPKTGKVTRASLCFGGMAVTPKQADATAKYLVGRSWDTETLEGALAVLAKEMFLPPQTPGGMADYRTALCCGFFRKFFNEVRHWLHGDVPVEEHSSLLALTGAGQLPTGLPKFQDGTLMTEPAPKSDKMQAVGAAALHAAAQLQATGKASFTDDIPRRHNELAAALVLSPRAHGKFKGDPSALYDQISELDGVHSVVSAKDVPGSVRFGDIVHDDVVFADGEVLYAGQPVAIVLADDVHVARQAAHELEQRLEFEELPAVLSIQDAIDSKSFHTGSYERSFDRGSYEEPAADASSLHTVTSVAEIGGQEHFYLEPQTTLAEIIDGEISLYASTQNVKFTQHGVAAVLGLPYNKVHTHVRRIGGGFGGKETSSVLPSCIAAMGAFASGRPVRLLMDRHQDFAVTGKRHPFKGVSTLKADRATGRIHRFECRMYNNAGYSHDLSGPVMDRSLLHLENAYKVPRIKASGNLCKTNLPSNTAFRGFGGPQGMLVMELALEKLATEIGLPPHEVRYNNLIKPSEKTFYGQDVLVDIPAIWGMCMEQSQFMERYNAVEEFNQASRFVKRGIAIVPAKFGLSFTATFLNQGMANVMVYTDGTVLINHGGVEMGQGLHTKMCQIAAHSLGIPVEDVYVQETSTTRIPNSSPTAASMGSDIYGGAVLDACEAINERLQKFRKEHPNFKDAVNAAYFSRVSLSALGTYKTDLKQWDSKEGGDPFAYFTSGVGASEVEVDTLTGDFRCLRTDIVMDVGQSINPAIDIGQIEGAFVQGMGWMTNEELVWGDKEHEWIRPGHLQTKGPGAYKIPGMDDIPRQLNVSLFPNSFNKRAVHSSRGVGEPPILLSVSVVMALRHAIQAARLDNGMSRHDWFDLQVPLTAERIRMACADPITRHVLTERGRRGATGGAKDQSWAHYQAFASV